MSRREFLQWDDAFLEEAVIYYHNLFFANQVFNKIAAAPELKVF